MNNCGYIAHTAAGASLEFSRIFAHQIYKEIIRFSNTFQRKENLCWVEQASKYSCIKCRQIIHRDDIYYEKKNLFNINVWEKVCPHCKGKLTFVDIPEELDRFLYVNEDKKYYN